MSKIKVDPDRPHVAIKCCLQNKEPFMQDICGNATDKFAQYLVLIA